MPIKLTDAQLLMMIDAAKREDRCLVLPKKLKGAALTKVGGRFVEAGLAREIKARADAPIWRRDDEDRAFALKLTAAGLKATAVEDDAVGDGTDAAPEKTAQPAHSPDPASSSAAREATPRPSSKLASVIGLLRRDDGATIADLTEATGWLPHTTRAAITGLRKRGYSVTRARNADGASAYRIQGLVAAAEPKTARRAAKASSKVTPASASGGRRAKAKRAA